MVRTIFKAKTSQVNRAATPASAAAASAYGRDLDNWPRSWMGLEKDLPPGEALVVCFRSFIEHLATSSHKYLTLVYQIDQGLTRLLWVGKERTIESFQGFFTVIGEQLAAQIEFVCSDMWQPYLEVIRQKCSQALHILDRFHIVAKMNKALDEVRAAESRKMAREGHEPLLKKSRWCVLKRKENLTSQQNLRLRELLRYNLQTVRAYLLKEDFQQFWEYNSPTWAGNLLDFWCYQTMRSRIEPMKKIARTLRAHRSLLLNYFKAKKQFSSGVVEGLNNKAKVTMRRSYGFRTFRILELALYHSLGKLPEPELTHDFF